VIDLLEMEQFRHPEDRDRLNEVRALAQQQVSDDTGATRSRPHRIGKKGDIYPADPLVDRPDSELTQLWPERTDEQLDRAAGLEPFIAGLTGEQRIMVRLRYDAQMTQDEIADILHIDQSNVNRRLATIHKQLRAALLEAFVPEAA
jgi:RNA polymerase sigma factor (sigma-70 family)